MQEGFVRGPYIRALTRGELEGQHQREVTREAAVAVRCSGGGTWGHEPRNVGGP